MVGRIQAISGEKNESSTMCSSTVTGQKGCRMVVREFKESGGF